MKINLSDIWNAHLPLSYFKSKAIVLYVALLITRWFSRENEKEDVENIKKEKEMTSDKQKHRKKQSYLPCIFNSPH